jgi:hypothetical protein
VEAVVTVGSPILSRCGGDVPARVRIGDREFYVAGEAEVHRLKSEMVEALRMGGGFVDLPEPARGISALISPGILVIVEDDTRTDATGDGNVVIIEIDSYDHFDWPAYGEIQE